MFVELHIGKGSAAAMGDFLRIFQAAAFDLSVQSNLCRHTEDGKLHALWIRCHVADVNRVIQHVLYALPPNYR